MPTLASFFQGFLGHEPSVLGRVPSVPALGCWVLALLPLPTPFLSSLCLSEQNSSSFSMVTLFHLPHSHNFQSSGESGMCVSEDQNKRNACLHPSTRPPETHCLSFYYYTKYLPQGRKNSPVIKCMCYSSNALEFRCQCLVSAGPQPPKTLVPGGCNIPGLSEHLHSLINAHTIIKDKI